MYNEASYSATKIGVGSYLSDLELGSQRATGESAISGSRFRELVMLYSRGFEWGK